MNTHKLSARDTFALDWYFFKLDLLLAGMREKHAKAIKKELKAGVLESIADRPMKDALAELGPVNVLASNYLEAYGKPVPRVWAGIVAFGVLLYGWLLGVISILEGMHTTISALDVAAQQTVTKQWLLADIYAEVGPQGIESFGFEVQGWNLVLLLAVFIGIPLICARVWRAWKK